MHLTIGYCGVCMPGNKYVKVTELHAVHDHVLSVYVKDTQITAQRNLSS